MDITRRTEELQRQHQELERQLKIGIAERYDSLQLTEIKRKKLKIKDELARLTKFN